MIGLLGGTFDPVHYGHLHIAQALYQQLHLQEVRFIPCKIPLLNKKVYATEKQRLAMLQEALNHYAYFSIDERELHRTTPSYTLDTLISLRYELPHTPLGLILGSDNLSHLDQWYHWTSLIQQAHLLIVSRPSSPATIPTTYSKDICHFIRKFQTNDTHLLSQKPAGFLFMAKVKPLPISASSIRKKIADGHSTSGLLPPPVLHYILEQKLYL